MHTLDWNQDFITRVGSEDGVRYVQNGINYDGDGNCCDKKQVTKALNEKAAAIQENADKAMAEAKATQEEAARQIQELGGATKPATRTTRKK